MTRYILTHNYIGCPCKVNDIIVVNNQGLALIGNSWHNESDLIAASANWRKMEWWEGLTIGQLPVYVNTMYKGEIIKINEWVPNGNGFFGMANNGRSVHAPAVLPATEAEYEEYMKGE